jgi:5-methylcytosine-specific restriction protein A
MKRRDKPKGVTAMVAITGKQLNRDWEVWALHALYRRDGTWYNLLDRFPGALFDTNGYIPFQTRDDFNKFRQRRGVSGRKQIYVQGGIAGHPDYILVNPNR